MRARRRKPRTGAAAAGVTLAASLALLAGPAAAHGPAAPEPGFGLSPVFPPALDRSGPEIAALGAEHAAEHAAGRERIAAARRAFAAMSPREQRSYAASERAEAARIAARADGPASEIGRWTQAPFAINEYAIHAVLLPTGKVLMWGYSPIDTGTNKRPNDGNAFLWDPAKGTGPASMTQVNPPVEDHDGDPGTPEIRGPLYCSGQTLLPNGEVLAVGGNLVWPSSDQDDLYTDVAGWKGAYTFNPWTETWERQPDTLQGRWYPSQVLLGNGDTMVFAGYDETPVPQSRNNDLEVFKHTGALSSQGLFDHEGQGDRDASLYPHLFTMPDGDVLMAGPADHDVDLLETSGPDAFRWHRYIGGSKQIPEHTQDRIGGNAVLIPGGPGGSSTIDLIGGFEIPPNTNTQATATVERLDVSADVPAWAARPGQNHGRSYANTVILPDGNLVTIGGGRGRDENESPYATNPDGSLRQVELYNRTTGEWRLGPAQLEDRAYHSIAMLLPDGRVLSAGDDFNPAEPSAPQGASTSDTAEIYSPPYLFRGPRPRLSSAPPTARFGDALGIGTPDDDLVRRAVLMAPPAVTHGADMHQRQVPLRILRRVPGVGIDVRMPSDGNVAPPGYYMLFLLDSKGVPSFSRWVRVSADGPDRPRLTPDRTKPRLGLRLTSGRRLAFRTGRLHMRTFLGERGRVRLVAKLIGARGRRLQTRIRLARMHRVLTRRASVRFAPRGVRRAARAARGRIVVVATGTDAAGNRRIVRRRLKL